MRRSVSIYGMVLFLGLLALCGCSRETITEDIDLVGLLHSLGVDKYMGIEHTTPTFSGDWEVYRYGTDSQAICYSGAEFVVSLKRRDPKKVILYLEGGGGCWDYSTCYAAPVAQAVSGTPTTDTSRNAGFLSDDPENPLHDWSVVYASYCDASVWSGDNDIVYAKDDGSDPRLTYHHGLANLSAAVTLLKKNFMAPEKVLVAGSSAGGYGTLMGYIVTKLQYPETPIYVINDSGPDIVNPADPGLLENARKNWNFDQYLPTSVPCPKCDQQMLYIVRLFLRYDPLLRYGIFSYYQDAIVGTFFLQMDGRDYERLLVGITNEIREMKPDHFKRFFVDGRLHTTMTLLTYYTLEVRGTYFNQWVGDLVTDSPQWSDLLE